MPAPIQLYPGLKRVASFRPGVWNGRPFSRQFVQYLYDNFQEYSTGDKPWYVPFVNLNHNDEFRFGKISKAELDKSGTLFLWAENLPVSVAQWLDAHMLDERSIEFIEPKIDPKTKAVLGFTLPDGSVCKTPVLKCLSLLGNDVPAVKGLPPMPAVSYMRDTGGRVSQFSSRTGPRMNQELLNQLQALGFDLSKIPADATDDLLNEILKMVQAANKNVPAPDPSKMSQLPNPAPAPTLTPTPAPAAPLTPALPGLQGQPEQVIMKFFDTMLAPMRTEMNQLRAQASAAVTNSNASNERNRDTIVTAFLDRMGKSGQVSPAMRPGVEKSLKRCDYLKVSKFSAKLADGREQGTDLEEQMNLIETTYPVMRTHNNPSVTQDAPGQGSAVRPEVVNRALQGSPEGRAYLARQKAAGVKK